MNAGLFSARRPDGRAEWRVVFDLAVTMEPGETLTHDQLRAELDTDDMQRVYRAVGGANTRLWKDRRRSLASVPGTGYRMLHATEHEVQADDYRKQGRRKVGKAVAVMDAVDLDAIPDSQREWAVKVQGGLRILAQAMDSHARTLHKHDDMISRLTERVDRLEKQT